MVTRENKVIAAAFVGFVAAIVGGAAFGLEGPIFGALVLVAIPILGPQLYLAATSDDGVAPVTRIRVSVLLSLSFCSGRSLSLGPAANGTVVGAILFVLIVGLLAYEFYGYRSRAVDC